MTRVGDLDVLRTAKMLADEHGPTAWFEAAQQADRLLDGGDVEGCRVWLRILSAINAFQEDARPEGATSH